MTVNSLPVTDMDSSHISIPKSVIDERDKFANDIKKAERVVKKDIDNDLVRLTAETVLTGGKTKYIEARRCVEAFSNALSRFPCAKVTICTCNKDVDTAVNTHNVTINIRSIEVPGWIIATISANTIGTSYVDPAAERQAKAASEILSRHVSAACKFTWADYAHTGATPSLRRLLSVDSSDVSSNNTNIFSRILKPVVLTPSIRTVDVICGHYIRKFGYEYALEIIEGYGAATVYTFNRADISYDIIPESSIYPLRDKQLEAISDIESSIRDHNNDVDKINEKIAAFFRGGKGAFKMVDALGELDCNACIRKDHILKYCSGCGMVKYCSQECQRKDWPDHKNMCRVFAIKK